MKRSILIVVLLLVVAAPASSQDDPCPCVPVTKVWIAKECNTWSCAVAELVKAEGDPLVFTLPTSSSMYKWVVLRRVNSGSASVFPPAPFTVESFDSSSIAGIQHALADPAKVPMLVTTVDGKALLVTLRDPDPEIARRRALRR